MKLNRETISGTIKEINWDRVAAIGLTIGLVTIGGAMINMNMERESAQLDHYETYSEQVESLFGSDVSEEKEEILDNLQENLNLVNQYKHALTEEEVEQAVDQMIETKDSLKQKLLNIVKIDTTKESGRNPNEYNIRPQDKADGDGWEIYRKENGVTKEFYKLDSNADTLVSFAESLDEISEENVKQTEIASIYEDAIKEAATYIGKQAQKEGNAK